MQTAKQIIEKYLLVWLLLLCCIAFYERVLPIQIFSGALPFLKYLVFIAMFAVGWMLPRDEIRQVIARWPTVFGGTAIQYAVMPTAAYFLAKQFQLSEGLMIGTIMVGCVPGAMASNVLTLMARGSTGYSVSLTTSATLLSPIVVPLVMALTLGANISQYQLVGSAINLGWMVVMPVTVGHLLSRRWPNSQATATIVGSIVANLAILWIVASVVAANRERLQSMQSALILVAALLLLNFAGYLAGYLGGRCMRLSTGMRRALTLEVGMQNAGLGTAMVTGLFPDDPSVAIPTAIYTFGCMFTGTILARIWSSLPQAEQDATS